MAAAIVRRCCVKKVFLNISQNSQVQIEFCEIFKNTYFVKQQTNSCFCSGGSVRWALLENLETAFSHAVFYIIFSNIGKSYFRTLGIYAKTFAVILYYDISKFLVVYGVVLIAFTGSVYLAVNAEAKGLKNAG